MGLVVIVSVTSSFCQSFWRYSLSTESFWKQHDSYHAWSALFNWKVLQHSALSSKMLIHKVLTLLCGTYILASLKPWHTTNKAVQFILYVLDCPSFYIANHHWEKVTLRRGSILEELLSAQHKWTCWHNTSVQSRQLSPIISTDTAGNRYVDRFLLTSAAIQV